MKEFDRTAYETGFWSESSGSRVKHFFILDGADEVETAIGTRYIGYRTLCSCRLRLPLTSQLNWPHCKKCERHLASVAPLLSPYRSSKVSLI